MARVKGGLNAKKKHNRTLKLAKGYRGARSKQYRIAKQSVMRARMITEGMLRKINKENVPNLEYVNLEMLFGNDNPYYDPTNEYSVPYTYGT